MKAEIDEEYIKLLQKKHILLFLGPQTKAGKILIIFYLPIMITLTGLMFSHLFSQALGSFIDEKLVEMYEFDESVTYILFCELLHKITT